MVGPTAWDPLTYPAQHWYKRGPRAVQHPSPTATFPSSLPDYCCSSSPATTRNNGWQTGHDLPMSSSTSASRRTWPRYGAVPMTSCPVCPRTAPLKRLVTLTNKNGNLGREFVKCESKPEQGKVRFYFSICQFWFLCPNFIFFIRFGI